MKIAVEPWSTVSGAEIVRAEAVVIKARERSITIIFFMCWVGKGD